MKSFCGGFEKRAAERFFVYRNVNKSKTEHVYSLRSKEDGKVKQHLQEFYLKNPVFKVSDAGRDRVRREGVKNVHAGIEGELVDMAPGSGWAPVTYDPKKHNGFIKKDNMEPVTEAQYAKFTPQGVFVR